MASKSQLLKALNFLKSCLSEKKEASAPLAELQEVIEEGEWSESQGGDFDSFVVPQNVVAAGGLALFSDGACRGNPGPGAWGMLGQSAQGKLIFESSGVDTSTTNNRMEIIGAIEALKAALDYCSELGKNFPLWLYSDSRYLVDGMNSWVSGWKKRGWKKGDNKVPENVELWQELDQLNFKFEELTFIWVKGHAGHPQNEYCDRMANNALDDAGF